jgi:hypothetical protein
MFSSLAEVLPLSTGVSSVETASARAFKFPGGHLQLPVGGLYGNRRQEKVRASTLYLSGFFGE